MTYMETKIDYKEQIELAAENLARIVIQQVLTKRNKQINKKDDDKYGKSN